MNSNTNVKDTDKQNNNYQANTNIQIPVASFSSNFASGKSPLTVNFIDQSTNSPTAWKWTFGDGTTSTLQNPTHTFTSIRSYDVHLKVKNSAGSDTIKKKII